jgi:hypothetical protein
MSSDQTHYTLAMNLVTLKCQHLNGNNSVISALVMKFFTILEQDGLIASHELSFISICTNLFFLQLHRQGFLVFLPSNIFH